MKRASLEMSVGIFVVIGLICVSWLTIKLGKAELLGDNHYTVSGKFQSVSGLKTGAVVEMAGVQVGKVDVISLDQERMVAVVTMKIQKDVKLSDDSMAAVKTSGLIGDKYIKISPGGSDLFLKSGDVITETESAIDLEDMIKKYVFGSM
ncbi:MAG: outer membrane lipid asymmetry maintenance protein MlaD [Desulfococcaceae bacterium]